MHRIRFSLLNALWLMTILGLGLALWREHSELAPLRVEVQKLRNETGHLSIEDGREGQLHAIRVRSADPLAWWWKAHLPEGQNYELWSYVGKLPADGSLPGRRDGAFRLGSPPAGYRVEEPQSIVIAALRDTDGDLVLRQAFGGVSTQDKLSEEQAASFSSYGGHADMEGVFFETSRKHKSHALVLLRQRRFTKAELNATQTEPYGVLVWIEEVVFDSP